MIFNIKTYFFVGEKIALGSFLGYINMLVQNQKKKTFQGLPQNYFVIGWKKITVDAFHLWLVIIRNLKGFRWLVWTNNVGSVAVPNIINCNVWIKSVCISVNECRVPPIWTSWSLASSSLDWKQLQTYDVFLKILEAAKNFWRTVEDPLVSNILFRFLEFPRISYTLMVFL